MIKFQKIAFKFTTTTFLLLILGLGEALGADAKENLQVADSLFEAQKYTESFEHYRAVYDAGRYSPAMLLHMAFIKEGLGQSAESLFYLNQYYLLTLDRSAHRKMSELAQNNELMGYRYSDLEFLISIFARFRETGIMLALAACILLAALVLRYKWRKKQKPVTGLVFLTICLLITAAFTNLTKPAPHGIIMSNQAYLLDQPSAGGNLIEIAGKGHRVKILDDGEVWVKIAWKDKKAYIRKQNLWSVEI